jgi:biliverdin reductase
LSSPLLSPDNPLRVGIVGTGYAAQRRAEVLLTDPRAQLITVAGHSDAKITEFCQQFGIQAADTWQALIANPTVDLVIVATINQLHGAIATAALQAGKHVVLEYPLALDYATGQQLQTLAQQQNKLLHVEHIELLGGVHQAIRQQINQIGQVFYARYSTIQPQSPAPHRWTYQHQQFGFPLIAALSRISRLTDLFGSVHTVSAQSQFWPQPDPDYFRACLCTASLRFESGLMAEVVYGKGDVFHQGDRTFRIDGEQGSLLFVGETGQLIQRNGTTPIPVGSRRGLFKRDTEAVLDYFQHGKPLYTTLHASLNALKVADYCAQASQSCQTLTMAD